MNGFWGRRLGAVVIVALVLFGMLYVGDWLVLRFRVARGTAFGTVEVHQFLATSLKGNKTEYDLVGTFQEPAAGRSSHSRGSRLAGGWNGIMRSGSEWFVV
ncbi:MAG: hypothetical protein WBV26_16340 [Candidatus Sulfotelmatobacter sp.]